MLRTSMEIEDELEALRILQTQVAEDGTNDAEAIAAQITVITDRMTLDDVRDTFRFEDRAVIEAAQDAYRWLYADGESVAEMWHDVIPV